MKRDLIWLQSGYDAQFSVPILIWTNGIDNVLFHSS
jgi:hypothetical protein